ncbi:MAG: hypothetical protein HQL48_06775 [Gammaproteobacteria bacterium]|nr:hypothetical protein [Gammaproteobacteria bacterium]
MMVIKRVKSQGSTATTPVKKRVTKKRVVRAGGSATSRRPSPPAAAEGSRSDSAKPVARTRLVKTLASASSSVSAEPLPIRQREGGGPWSQQF